MRILYFAKDAPFINSGYGKCCREICTRLKRLGHEVAVFATVGNRGSFMLEWNGLRIYPPMENVMGEDIILDHYNDWKSDILITQMDLWPLGVIPDLALRGEINWVPYSPLDSEPIPGFIYNKLRGAVHVVTMCDWAKKKLNEQKIECASIHHGIDTNIYKVLGDDKGKLKAELGVPADHYLIGMVQANQFLRKAMEEQFLGIRIFKDTHPEIKFKVYCHTIPARVDSYDLNLLAQAIGIQDCIIFPNLYDFIKGFPEERMSRIYNAFDVLLSATNGEGFGLPVIEAQGCGVPVIGTDCMSFPELVKYGFLAGVKGWITMPITLRKALPNEYDIAGAIWDSYNTKWNRKEISTTAHYLWNWDSRIIQEWMWTLQIVEDKLNYRCHKVKSPSKMAKELSKEMV